MNKKIYALIVITLLLTGCSNFNTKNHILSENSQSIKKSSFLLDTIVTIQIYDSQDEDILNEAIEIIKKYDLIFSRTNEKSELYKLNHGLLAHDGPSYTISDELAHILSNGITYGVLSNGNFDITIAPILSLWDFKTENPTLPTELALKKAIPLVDYKNMTLEGNTLTFKKESMEIDLGGIAKGYTYLISFDAKSDRDRKIAVKIGGDDDNAWAVYSSQYAPLASSNANLSKHLLGKFNASLKLETVERPQMDFNTFINLEYLAVSSTSKVSKLM